MITRIEMEFYETLIRELPKIRKGINELSEQVKVIAQQKIKK